MGPRRMSRYRRTLSATRSQRRGTTPARQGVPTLSGSGYRTRGYRRELQLVSSDVKRTGPRQKSHAVHVPPRSRVISHVPIQRAKVIATWEHGREHHHKSTGQRPSAVNSPGRSLRALRNGNRVVYIRGARKSAITRWRRFDSLVREDDRVKTYETAWSWS